jgi:error-prone DNA polymerase
MGGFAQLHVHSAFSFLDGTDWPSDLVKAAAARGVTTMALTDWHRVSGLVSFIRTAEQVGIRPIAGATVRLPDGGRLVLLVPEPERYVQLTRLLTAALERHPRKAPEVDWEALEAWGRGLVALSGGRRGGVDRLICQGRRREAEALARRLRGIFGSDFYLEVGCQWLPGDRTVRRGLRDLGEALGIPLVAAPEVHHADRDAFRLYDILVAIRHGLRIEDPHPDRPLNAEQCLKTREEVARALGDLGPVALRTAEALAERLEPPRLLGQKRLPRFGSTRDAYRVLAQAVWAGARERYGAKVWAVRSRIRHELDIIRDLDFVDYFLAVADVVHFARRRQIRFAGRGSAADSVVAYCLGITQVDAARRGLLFERFLSRERAETPDIDIDLDARRRDEVADYVRSRYGVDRVAAVATYQTFRERLALRQVGKVLGFPPDELDGLARSLPPRPLAWLAERWDTVPELRALGLSPRFREVLGCRVMWGLIWAG